MSYPSFSVGEVLTANDMNAVGLWKLGTNTFSAQTGVNIDSVFTADYDVYRLFWLEADSNTAGETRVQFRTSGSTNANNNYVHQNNAFTTALTAVRNTVATSSALVTQNVGASGWLWEMVIYNPYSNARNTIFTVNGNVDTGSLYFAGGGAFNTTTRFDGIRITRTAGDMTGEYWLYGFRQ